MEPDPVPAPSELTDGRRRKGERRRRELVAATMRVIARAGVAQVTQRLVAREAGVPPSAVTYYFPTADALVVAALVAANEQYLRRLAACAASPDPLAALAEGVATWARGNREVIAAEYELSLLAARRPELQREVARWTAALDGVLAPVVADPAARLGVAAAVDGLMLRCLWAAEPPESAAVHAVLLALTRP